MCTSLSIRNFYLSLETAKTTSYFDSPCLQYQIIFHTAHVQSLRSHFPSQVPSGGVLEGQTMRIIGQDPEYWGEKEKG